MLPLLGLPPAPILHASSYLGRVRFLPEPGALGHSCPAPLDVFPEAEVLGLWQRAKHRVTVWAQVGPMDLRLPDSPAPLAHPPTPPPCHSLSHKAPGAPVQARTRQVNRPPDHSSALPPSTASSQARGSVRGSWGLALARPGRESFFLLFTTSTPLPTRDQCDLVPQGWRVRFAFQLSQRLVQSETQATACG